MGEPEDYVAIAKWSGRGVIILHTETDRCTIIPYTPNAIETKSVTKLVALKWTREPSREKHGIYLTHDEIHYSTLRLRDNQEEGEQNKKSINKECTNNTQQRRTKEQTTQTIQNNPSEEDTHGEGDKMRAINAPSRTQDNTQHPGEHTRRRG